MMLKQEMLLDAKKVMDEALPYLQDLYELVPAKLAADLATWIRDFKKSLARCDVVDKYVEKEFSITIPIVDGYGSVTVEYE